MAVKFARFNLLVVLLQLAAFLFVQAELPISQAVAMRPLMPAGGCAPRQCCCSADSQKHGTCCCSSKGAQTKSGCLLRASRCGENGPTSDTVIVVKFQIVLPMLTVVLSHDVTLKPVLPDAVGTSMRPTEPPDPPPRLLIPA